MSSFFYSLPVLVTGATGFIGSHLVRALIGEGANVSIIKRPRSSLWRVLDVIKKLTILEADLLDKSSLDRVLRNKTFGTVFHLAAHTTHERIKQRMDDVFNQNIRGSANLFHYFLNHPIRTFINTGTCEEYGDNPAPFDESMREKPVSPYSASKVAITHYGQMLHRIYNFPLVTVRPFLTYGPYQTRDFLIPYAISRALRSQPIETTKGKQTRELHYISDMVDGILLAATNKKAIGEVIDLGNGKEYKVRDVVKMVVTLTNSSSKLRFGTLPYRPGETLRFYCRGEKAKKILGWKPKISLQEGLKKTITWYAEHERKLND